MNKYCGKIGFQVTKETHPGLYVETIIEKIYYGDVLRSNRKLQNGMGINQDLNISNQISIIADPFINENLYSIRYLEWMGNKWTVSDIEVQYPRLILSLGGVYNNEN